MCIVKNMPSLNLFRRTFTFSWRMFICTLCAVVILMSLGHWQMMRAQEKRDMLSLAKMQARRSPVSWQMGTKTPVAYEALTIQGHYLPMVLLLDNQHHEHQFGYDIISPVILLDQSVILVDRGWVPADMTRQHLPDVNVPNQLQTLTGYAYYPSSKHWLLGPAFEERTANTTIIEMIDTVLIGKILHKSVYPFIIRLNSDEANGYIRQWPIVSMSPNRHIGYAIQWYVMALIVLGLFVGLNVKKNL